MVGAVRGCAGRGGDGRGGGEGKEEASKEARREVAVCGSRVWSVPRRLTALQRKHPHTNSSATRRTSSSSSSSSLQCPAPPRRQTSHAKATTRRPRRPSEWGPTKGWIYSSVLSSSFLGAAAGGPSLESLPLSRLSSSPDQTPVPLSVSVAPTAYMMPSKAVLMDQ